MLYIIHICDHIWLGIFFSIFSLFQSNKKFPKSKKGNENWTFLKMSNFGNPKKVSKNTVFSHCDQDALNYFFCMKKMSRYFLKKNGKTLGNYFL
jgi:hypothetical protein